MSMYLWQMAQSLWSKLKASIQIGGIGAKKTRSEEAHV
jgi:hypothetical protein